MAKPKAITGAEFPNTYRTVGCEKYAIGEDNVGAPARMIENCLAKGAKRENC